MATDFQTYKSICAIKTCMLGQHIARTMHIAWLYLLINIYVIKNASRS